MKTILCYGDSNTWGSIPGNSHDRWPADVRWPGVLQRLLGNGCHIVEEGLGGRTTVVDDPFEQGRNGKTYLPPCLRSHQPVDLVILMLGTNDLKQRFAFSPYDVAHGIFVLVSLIYQSGTGPDQSKPRVLLMAPPPFGKMTQFAEEFGDGPQKSLLLGERFAARAKELGCDYIDTGKFLHSSDLDGIHLEESEHNRLAAEIAGLIQSWPDW